MATTTLTPTGDSPKLVKKGSVSDMKSPNSATQTTFGCRMLGQYLAPKGIANELSKNTSRTSSPQHANLRQKGILDSCNRCTTTAT